MPAISAALPKKLFCARSSEKIGNISSKAVMVGVIDLGSTNSVLYADRQHFWPYGLNQDHESSPQSDLRFIKMLEAIRKDMGEN